MPLLYYWRPDNYRRDRAFGFGYHLNQNSSSMGATSPGDSLWAFTRRVRDSQYVLAAELVIRAVTRNPLNYRYGRWRVWGDLEKSRYFDIDQGPRVDGLVRELGVRAAGERLGQSFQGHAAVRVISTEAHQFLASYAADLVELDRIAIYPEDEFEARLIHDEPVRPLVARENPSDRDRRLAYLYESVDIRRARKNALELQTLYEGRCQICSYDPPDRYGHRTCEGHHIQWLSRGGDDDLDNMVLICPNHHAAIHRDDAVFDYADMTFTFTNGLREPLQINRHLPAA